MAKKNIAVVAADGRVARKVITEAVNRGWDVTAFGRKDENTGDAQTYVKKDILDLTREDLEGFDAVVDAFGAWTPETFHLHGETLQHLLDILAGTDVRLVYVGGAGSLYVNPEHTLQVYQTPDFPAEFVPLATAQVGTLAQIRPVNDVKWTYISPAGDFQADARSSRSTTAASPSSPTPTTPSPWWTRSSPATTSTSASRWSASRASWPHQQESSRHAWGRAGIRYGPTCVR